MLSRSFLSRYQRRGAASPVVVALLAAVVVLTAVLLALIVLVIVLLTGRNHSAQAPVPVPPPPPSGSAAEKPQAATAPVVNPGQQVHREDLPVAERPESPKKAGDEIDKSKTPLTAAHNPMPNAVNRKPIPPPRRRNAPEVFPVENLRAIPGAGPSTCRTRPWASDGLSSRERFPTRSSATNIAASSKGPFCRPRRIRPATSAFSSRRGNHARFDGRAEVGGKAHALSLGGDRRQVRRVDGNGRGSRPSEVCRQWLDVAPAAACRRGLGRRCGQPAAHRGAQSGGPGRCPLGRDRGGQGARAAGRRHARHAASRWTTYDASGSRRRTRSRPARQRGGHPWRGDAKAGGNKGQGRRTAGQGA